jgi:hypothetical protein
LNKVILHLAATSCCVAAGALCFHRFACNTHSAEESGPHLIPALREYLGGLALSPELQTRVESNHPRLQAKYAVVTELLARRLTLMDVEARLRDLDAGLPEVRDRLVQQYPNMPYEVALCRDVIDHARAVLRVRAPKQAGAVVACLEAELQAHLEREAGLRLP